MLSVLMVFKDKDKLGYLVFLAVEGLKMCSSNKAAKKDAFLADGHNTTTMLPRQSFGVLGSGLELRLSVLTRRDPFIYVGVIIKTLAADVKVDDRKVYIINPGCKV